MAEVNYTVRNMVKEDVPMALDVWRETGMNQSVNSLYTWLEVDPEAFKIAVTDEGFVIGVCAATIHNEDAVFVGLYCVRERYRGLGIGLKVWNACMEHIAHRNAFLYAIPAKVELYRSRGGFPIIESEWTSVSYCTTLPVNADKLSDVPPEGINIKPFNGAHLPLIYDYDKKIIGYDRHQAIKLICKEPDSVTFVAVKDAECVGFGIRRVSCQAIAIIGPLYSDNKEVAEVILKKLLSSTQVKGLFMLTLSNNDAVHELAERIGCPVNLKCPLLCRKTPVGTADHSKIYVLMDSSFSP